MKKFRHLLQRLKHCRTSARTKRSESGARCGEEIALGLVSGDLVVVEQG